MMSEAELGAFLGFLGYFALVAGASMVIIRRVRYWY